MTELEIIRNQLKSAVEELVNNGNPEPLSSLFDTKADEKGLLFVGEYEQARKDLDGFFAKSDTPTTFDSSMYE